MLAVGAAVLAVVAPAALTSGPADAAGAARSAGTTGERSGTAACHVAFDTSQNRFRPGLDNQGTVWGNSIDPPNGYWEGADGAAYAVGFEWEAPYELRNYFSFDLSSLPPGSATAAVLVLRNGNDWTYGPGGLLRMREVKTPAAALNLHTAPAHDVFDDAGTGLVYGARKVTKGTAKGPVVRIPLNATGIAALDDAAGGWFSLGGRLTNPGAGPFSILWRGTSSSYGVQRLKVTTTC